MSRPPKPFLQEIDEAADPSMAPAVPDALPEGQAMQAVAALSQRKGSALTRFALWAFGALFTFAISVAAYDFVAGLLARNLILGWLAFALVALAVVAGLVLALREWAAFIRLRRLDGLRTRAEAARSEVDLPAARSVVADLTRLYAARGDTAWGRARLAEREAEVMDADALLALAERELLTTLDAEARLVIESSARQVAMVTALVPLALADVATALVANLRMIRRIAEIYGGRSGSFGSLGLLRRVFGSLIAAGALALTDDMIGSVAGGGVLSKLSRRFGEGVVNGALTARVGLAAMELCRPMPFVALERPAVSSLVSRALTGLVSRG
ncbi:YcjF family protein [Tabrizicola sp.]|uniref:YcjF family protein n=1 Tax=Tabrizicola sp. TaxID=2005166 RepID=UPI003F3D3FCC